MVVAILVNVFRFTVAILLLPLRLLRRKRKPRFVRFLLRGNPPYLEKAVRRRLFRRRGDPSEVSSVEELEHRIQLLRSDPAIEGILVIVQNLHVSSAKRQALAALFAQFRQAGKHVVAYAHQASTEEYELMCSADRILFAPGGVLFLTGFAAETTALGNGLGKIGIEAHFVRRGEYKTAPELFTESTLSRAHRETVDRILDNRYAELLEAICVGRQLEEKEARLRVDGGPYTARQALAEKLCDGLHSEPGLEKELAEPSPFVDYARSLLFPTKPFLPLKRRPRVAVVPLSGVIADADLGLPSPFPVIAGADRTIEAIKAAVQDSRAHALVLTVDSPGGSAVASERILEEVKVANQKKPVVAYFDRVAASGGYLAALGAKEIWAAKGAIVGSIGVFGGKLECSSLLQRLGIGREVLTRGENAGLFSLSRGFTDSERKALELTIEDTYQSFLEHVALARGMSKEEVHAKAEGRVYTGEKALEAGLIHGVGSFNAACQRALQLAGKESARYGTILHVGKPKASSPVALLRRFSSMQLYALMDPWLSFPSLGDAETWIH